MQGLEVNLRVPAPILYLAIAASLFMNLVNINLVGMVADNQKANTVLLCQRVQPTTTAVNDANGTFHSVIQNSLDNALGRINTPKELPSDKKTVQQDQVFLPKFHTATPPKCNGFK